MSGNAGTSAEQRRRRRKWRSRLRRRARHAGYAAGMAMLLYLTLVAPPVGSTAARWTIRLAAVGLLAWGTVVEPNWLRLRPVRVVLKDLPRALDGLRIAHVSDIHFGGTGLPARGVRRVVRKVLAASPDLIVLTGDFVNGHAKLVAPVARLLEPLEAPLGVFAVLGNHDPVDREFVAETLSSAGLQVLNNEARVVKREGATLGIVGVDDVTTGRHALAAAEGGLSEAVEVTLLLSHSPSIALQLDGHQVDLILSGHTHGGQVRLPGMGPHWIEQSIAGASCRVCISAGVGHRFPFRLCCRPEVPVVELRRADKD